MEALPDYYGLLGVAPGAPLEEIRGAYRRLARQHHPDTSGDPASATEMRRINEAWETLRDPGRRAAYDRARPRVAAPRRPAATGRKPRERAPAPRPAPQPARERPEPAKPAGSRAAVFTGDPSFDWYAAVGVGADASRDAVRAALGRMAAELEGARISATEYARRRQVLKDAWAVLGDAEMRAAYDSARQARRSATPPGSNGAGEDGAPIPAGYRVGPVTVAGVRIDAGADCSGADLRGVDLRGLDLAGIRLAGARLQGAELEGASLRRADLRGADFSGASLRWADLSHADCGDGVFRQADLSRASLAGTKFTRCDLSGANLAGAVGPGIDLEFADLRRADFSGAKVTPALIARGRLEGTVFPDGSVRGG